MILSSEFYYQEAQTKVSYSRTPPGVLDLDQMINQKPCWGLAAFTRVTKKKTLILADWTVQYWSDEKDEMVLDVMTWLFAEGFPLYYWSSEQLIPITCDNLRLACEEVIRPTHPEEIYGVAARKKLHHDQIHILDDHVIECLCQQNFDLPRTLKLSLYLNYSVNHQKHLFSIIKQAKPPLTEIIQDVFSTEGNKQLSVFKQFDPCIKLQSNYEQIEINEALANWLVQQPNTAFNDGMATITLEQFLEIKEMKYLININFFMNFLPESLLKLQKIDCSRSSIDSSTLCSILKAAPNVIEIDITCCENLTDDLKCDFNSLLSLKSVNTTGNHCFRSLHTILDAAPYVRWINLSCCEQIEDFCSKLTPGCLPSLKEMILIFTDLRSSDMYSILRASPNLKRIDLSECETSSSHKGFLDDLALCLNSQPSLESVSLAKTAISSSTLVNILRAANYLKFIDLSSCVSVIGDAPFLEDLELRPNSLPNLEHIDVRQTTISISTLQTIYRAAPNLRLVGCNSYTHISTALQDAVNCMSETVKMYTNKKQESLREDIDELVEDSPEPDSNSNSEWVPPRHDLDVWQHFKPPAEDKPFKFIGINPQKNQKMVIVKLSQYLTITQQNLHVIPIIQPGICLALAYFFKEREIQQWDGFLNTVSEWDGSQNTLTDSLKGVFDALYTYVDKYYLQPRTDRFQFLGHKLTQFLNEMSMGTNIVLSNGWHAIVVIRSSTEYKIYDPNNIKIESIQELERAVEHIFETMGCLVSVSSSIEVPNLDIQNFSDFIEQGGLISLLYCSNADAILSYIPRNFICSQEALEGVFLRTTKGHPAWLEGLNHQNTHVRKFVFNLLMQLQQAITPLVFYEKLTKSAADMAPAKKSNLSSNVIPCISPLSSNMGALALRLALLEIRRSGMLGRYEAQLITWKPRQASSETILQYCQRIVRGADDADTVQKRLIECNFTRQLDSMASILHHYCEQTQRPVFYIDKPEDLRCSAPVVERHGAHTAHLKKAPGGPLYDFLTQHQNSKSGPVLIVNYDYFKADDLVRFNGIVDTLPHADGIPLPVGTVLVCLTNKNSPDYYNGADFKSRFDTNELCPFTTQVLCQTSHVPPILEVSLEGGTPNFIINLYHSPDWQARLLGRWIINGQEFTFQEGELQMAIDSRRPIEIRNGLWGERAFDRFWQRIQQDGIYYAGSKIRLPLDTTIFQSEGYHWDVLTKNLILEQGLSSMTIPVLNMATLGHFFYRYDVDNDSQSLIHRPGYIQTTPNEMAVNVTSTLTDDAWAMLLAECRKQGVLIKAYCAPGVQLPEQINFERTPLSESLPWNSSNALPLQLIESSDVDTTVAMVSQTGEWHVIDVSECQSYDLLHHLYNSFDEETLHFSFSQQDGALLRSLWENKNVILKGRFSEALVNNLASFLINKEQEQSIPGKLLMITEPNTAFHFLQTRSFHNVSIEEKQMFLGDESTEIMDQLRAFLDNEPLSKLQARARYLHLNPGARSENTWQGMYDLSGGVYILDEPLDVEKSVEQAHYFTTQRINAVEQVLNSNPYVFLTGLSGVGKTTFVQSELCRPTSNYVLFIGEDHIKGWAEDTSDRVKLLFLDEANLSHREWSEFEGLFQDLPSILIDGTCYRLSPHHKVVFAGNPVQYGDERKLAPLFQRHGGAIVFEPLSKAFIYEKIIKPIFENQAFSSEQIQTIGNIILDAYVHICKCSKSEVLISPRELQTMALLALCNYKNKNQIAIEDHAKRVVYEIGKPLIPADDADSMLHFEQKFKPEKDTYIQSAQLTDSYLITTSRQSIIQHVQERLQLRSFRNEHAATLNDEQKYGGLGALVIEGMPGIGKSELVIHMLLAAGYKKQQSSDLTQPSTHTHPFYIMPVSMTLSEKQALLRKAFNEGAIVVIDEINSSPMMEQFLNALLMGRDPKNGQRPEKPGFMIIGTQNPINMAGRRAASTALLRRMTTVILPEYDTNEIRSILVHKGIFYWDAVVMADAYQNKLDEAKKFHLSPMPCLRDLLKLADQQIKRVHLAQQRAALLSPPPKHDLPESTPEDTYSFFHAKKAKNTTTDATETMDNDHQPPSPRI